MALGEYIFGSRIGGWVRGKSNMSYRAMPTYSAVSETFPRLKSGRKS